MGIEKRPWRWRPRQTECLGTDQVETRRENQCLRISELGDANRFRGLDDGVLRVQVPDQVTKEWMEQEYGEEIRDTIRELNLPVDRVVYIAASRQLGRLRRMTSGSCACESEPVVCIRRRPAQSAIPLR